MSSNDFGGAVIPAMAGFFLFGKRAKVQEIQEDKPKQLPAIIKTNELGLTGVAKYLISMPLVTGVSKYLKKKDKEPITGVEKYLLRKTIVERNAPAVTGVAKYIAKAAKNPPIPVKSGVERYIAKQERALKNNSGLTGVAKYEAEQDLIERKKAAAAMVKKYREQEEAMALVAKNAAADAYESSKANKNQEEPDIDPVASTRVAGYLQKQAQLAKKQSKATGVSRYVAKQIILDSQKPALSKVQKYLQGQTIALKKMPKATGVARYLAKQPMVSPVLAKKTKPLAPSGVARYLEVQSTSESNKPVLSGVAKYLKTQAQLESIQENTLKLTSAVEGSVAVENTSKPCLEGEFIPAETATVPLTGVTKYLDKQRDPTTLNEVAIQSQTGVSRYLAQRLTDVSQQTLPLRTGVDKYLANRA